MNLKRLILLLIVFVLLSAFTSINNVSQFYKGTIGTTHITFLKENYNWQNQEYLIISYRQPRSYCHYDNLYNEKHSIKWFDKNLNINEIQDARRVYVYNEVKSQKSIDKFEYAYADKNTFLFNNFFQISKSCYGLIVFNSEGKYFQKNGEFEQHEILGFIKELKRKE